MRLKTLGLRLGLVAAVCFVTLIGFAQESTPVGAASAYASGNGIPGLINYNGVLKDINGKALTDITGVTFALYKRRTRRCASLDRDPEHHTGQERPVHCHARCNEG